MPFDTMQLPALRREAIIRAGTADEKARTVEVVWTTGATVRRRRFWSDDIDEELVVTPAALRLERLNAGAPFLNAHSAYELNDVLGVVVDGSVRIEAGKGYATIRFSDREDVQPIFRDVVGGIIRNISVGYRVHKYEIEKRDGAPELWRAVDWEPLEISAVPIGADPGAQFRSDAEGAENFSVAIIRRDQPAVQPAKEERTVMSMQNNPSAGGEGGDNGGVAPAALESARNEGAAAERQRSALIEDLGKRFVLGDAWVKRMKEGSMTEDQIRNDALEEIARRDDETSGLNNVSDPVRVGRTAEDKFIEGAANAIICRAGAENIVRQAAGASAARLDAGQFRGFRLVDIARASLEFRGERVSLMSPEQVVRRALELSTRSSAGYGAQGTGDFGVLLENVMHKILLSAYAVTPDTWRRFCKVGAVGDFRDHNRYRTGSFGTLDALNEHGEFKNKSIPDGEKYKIAVATKGNVIGLSRQAIVNDDLSAFSDLATMLGRAAKLSIESDVYATLALNGGLGPTLLDGLTLFHANHGNITQAGAISVDLFDAARVLMKSQKDVSKNEVLDIAPDILLIGAASAGNAKVIVGAEYDPDTANKLQKPNKVKGIVRDIVDTARLTGTRFYFFANPDVAPVLEVAFLNGQQEPFLDSDEGWRTDGVEWKVRIDYGVAGQDYRGAVTGAGA